MSIELMEFVRFRQDQKRRLEYAIKVTHRDNHWGKNKNTHLTP